MPEISVILDIEEFAKQVQKPDYKGLRGYYDLSAICPECHKDFGGDVLEGKDSLTYGKATLKDGTEWRGSGKQFQKDDGFNFEQKSMLWLFDNSQLWGREDSICVCSLKCAKLQEKKFRQKHGVPDKGGFMSMFTRKDSSGAVVVDGDDEAKGKDGAEAKANGKDGKNDDETSGPEKADKELLCSGCQKMRPQGAFSSNQLAKKGKRKCQTCVV